MQVQGYNWSMDKDTPGSTDASVAVLAGGLSRRMGQDKSFVPLRGRPMIEHTLARVRSLNLPLLLITNQPESFGPFDVPLYGDVLKQKGSLVGLHSALSHSTTLYTLCIACDMPLLSVDLLRHLISLGDGYDAVVPCPAQQTEPLHAIYHRNCLPVIEAQIKQGDMQISLLYASLNVRFVTDAEIREIDPELRSFTNANTPDELAAIEALL
jgi:molybdopterin-guanine dinucleotide biosynthesis protein A